MKHEILSCPKGQPMTHPQGGLLFKFTGLKFWQPESLPQPTIEQAAILIGGIIAWSKKEVTFTHREKEFDNSDLLETIQLWFPSFEDLTQIHPRFFKKRAETEKPQPEPQPESKPKKPIKTQGKPKPEPQPEPQPEPKPEPKPTPPKPVKGTETILSLIDAGLRNIWLVGPAGCGKTTICKAAGDEMEQPVTVIPCGAGTSATTFLGYKYPEREATPFVGAFAKAGIIVLDEFTALEAQVAQVVNAALANNELTATTGTSQRHPDCVIIATSNTYGHGADRMYVSNNQLDASTIDRFAGGIIEIDYSREYENQYDPEVTQYAWHLRELVDKNGIRKVVSTRGIISACLLKAKKLEWKSSFTANWSKDEKALLR
jgi:hypothetical protein